MEVSGGIVDVVNDGDDDASTKSVELVGQL